MFSKRLIFAEDINSIPRQNSYEQRPFLLHIRLNLVNEASLDIDGVIHRSGTVLPHTRETISLLQELTSHSSS